MPPPPRPTTRRKREEVAWTAEGPGTAAVFRAAALATQHCPGQRGARRVRGARSQSSRQTGSATERPPGGVAAVALCPPGLRSHPDISLGRCGGPFPAASPSTQVFFPSSVARTSSSPVNTATDLRRCTPAPRGECDGDALRPTQTAWRTFNHFKVP